MRERFILQASTTKRWWVATDTENGIVIRFEDHKFNDTQKVTLLDDAVQDPMVLARAMREIGDWLRDNHYGKVF